MINEIPVKLPNRGIELAGLLFTPPGFDATKRWPAVVVVHPAGGVKEQTTATYARRLAETGLVTLAYDSSYQGESSGEPRQMEDPYVRVQDVIAGTDYLATLDFVDADRLGGLGICAGGGYAVSAAMPDRRLKAVATVSAVNIGDGMRFSWGGHETVATQNLIAQMEQLGKLSTAQAGGGDPVYVELTPKSLEGVTLPDMIEAHEYYHTPRAQHPRAMSRMLATDALALATFDAFHLADTFLTQPLMIVAGDKANTLWFSEELFRKAASAQKTLHLVPGATHIAMYDHYVDQAMELLAPFFREHLAN